MLTGPAYTAFVRGGQGQIESTLAFVLQIGFAPRQPMHPPLGKLCTRPQPEASNKTRYTLAPIDSQNHSRQCVIKHDTEDTTDSAERSMRNHAL